jgi:hypothetical protein
MANRQKNPRSITSYFITVNGRYYNTPDGWKEGRIIQGGEDMLTFVFHSECRYIAEGELVAYSHERQCWYMWAIENVVWVCYSCQEAKYIPPARYASMMSRRKDMPERAMVALYGEMASAMNPRLASIYHLYRMVMMRNAPLAYGYADSEFCISIENTQCISISAYAHSESSDFSILFSASGFHSEEQAVSVARDSIAKSIIYRSINQYRPIYECSTLNQ